MTDTDPTIEYREDRRAYVITATDIDRRFRLTVPLDLIEEDLGPQSDAAAQRDWLRAKLPQILTAYTARAEGGFVKQPWGRVLFEEL